MGLMCFWVYQKTQTGLLPVLRGYYMDFLSIKKPFFMIIHKKKEQ